MISYPAEINKEFTPIAIASGGISRLSVTIFNPNLFQITNVAWVDNLPVGIFIANPVNLSDTCNGTVVAPAGGISLSLSGGMVPPQVGTTPGSCTVSIDVTSTTPGNLINTIPAGGLTGTGGGGIITNTTPASATLRVDAILPPNIDKSFDPNTMWVGEVSQLTISITNTDPASALTQASLTDNLPANVILATSVSATLTGCGSSASLTAASGTGTVTLNNATIAPNSTCFIRVNVTSTVSGAYVNTIPIDALQTAQGATNTSPASAPLNVQGIGVEKSFSPEGFQAGSTTTLTITLQNPTSSPLTGVSASDMLPGTTLTVVPGTASTTCGTGTASAILPRTVSLTGGTVPAGTPANPGTCTISVQVTTPAGAFANTFLNTIPVGAITTNQGITNVLPAEAYVYIYAFGGGVLANKNFTPSTIEPGGTSLLTIFITAPVDTNLTNFSIVDNLPTGVFVSNPPAPSRSSECGASSILTAVDGAISVSLSGGTILAEATCQIEVYVTGDLPGDYTNVINSDDITNNEGRSITSLVTADLTIRPISNFFVEKSFTPDTVAPNGISTLTITLRNENDSPLIDVSLLDTLPGGTVNGVVVAPVPNATTNCGSGIVSATPGGKTVSITGGTVPPQVAGVPGICTIRVDVQGIGIPSLRNNIIPTDNVTATIQGTTTTVNPMEDATAQIRITNLTIGVVKGFNPLTVFGGSASTMSIQLVNPNNADLVGITFTDNMPTGMIVANPVNPNVGTCGGVITATPGDGSFTFSGGSLPPFGSCTLTISITMTVNGNLTNVILAGAVTTLNGASNPQPAEASLTNLPGASVSKAFMPNPINVGEYSLLTILIKNTGNVPITGMGLIDNLPGTPPAGLEISGAQAPINNCGGTVSAVPGTQLIQLTGGSLAENSSCSIVVAVTSGVPGSYENVIPAGALTSNEGATNNAPAVDTLVVLSSQTVTASLGDYVWLDANADGIQDVGEIGIDGVTVNLYASDGTLIATTTTSGGGLYLFDNLTPGDYYVEFIPPAGYEISPQDQGGNDATDSDINPSTGRTIVTTLVAGENDLTWDAGLYQLASLGDLVWNDTDADGVQDVGETGIDGVTVNLYASDGTLIATTVTSGGGLYLFDNLIPGDYYVEFVSPAGYVLSPQNQGGDDATDSDANLTTGVTVTTTLTSGENDLTWDAGVYQPASIGNYVWNDLNADGIQDANESGIDGVTVNLYASDGTLIATTTTSGGGLYLFGNLPPGDYYVEFVPPTGYVLSPQDQGGNDAVDSDANPTTGQTITTTLVAGANSLTWDAGIYLLQPPDGLSKTITGTNLSSTTGSNTSIGEIVTYQVNVVIPQGSFANARLVDTMDRGLAFVECVSINAPGLTTDVAGSFPQVCANPTTSDAGGGTPMDVDRQVTFNFGTLVNNSQSDAVLTITYNVIVLDIGTNVDGMTRINAANWSWSDGSIGPAQAGVTIVEPELRIQKTSNVNVISDGAEVTFTLAISHTAASATDAYDVVVTDILPTGLDFVANSLVCTSGAQDPDVACTYDAATRTIRAAWSVFTRNGGNGLISFRVVGNSSLPANGVTNTANVEWTSMPGDQRTPNSFSNPANPFATERYYDPVDQINLYGDSASLTLIPPGNDGGGNGGGGGTTTQKVVSPLTGGFLIPVTGFAPGVVSDMSHAPYASYTDTSITLDIPSLSVNIPIVGVPKKDGTWNVSWLTNQAGWLEGSAFPSWNGNSVLTSHVYLSNGKPGPFAKLHELKTGDQVIVRAFGQKYIFEVLTNAVVSPTDKSVMRHEEKPWLTLVTCTDYDFQTGTYKNRFIVRAVLVKVSADK